MAREAQDDLRITDQFDIELFWASHGKQITTTVAIVVVLALALLYWQHETNRRQELAADNLAHARDAASFEQVAREFPGTPEAAEALSRLGDLHFQNRRYTEAASAYERVTREFPTHPLAESAKLSLAAIPEAQGNLEAAKGLYMQIINSNGRAYVANAARMGLARCLELQGQAKEARQVYEEVLASGQNSPWFGQAYIRWVVLNRGVQPEKAEQPSAKQPTAPSQGGLQLPSLPTSP